MADYSQAKSALGYMVSTLQSFQNAGQVLDALANAEQVQKELDDANQKVRQSVANCKAEFEDLTSRIEQERNAAQAEAKKIVQDAKDDAQEIIANAQVTHKAALAAKEAAEGARDKALEEQREAEVARDAAVQEHDTALQKTADAKTRLAALLASD